MKKFFLLFFMLFALKSFSQDCSDIEYKKDEFTGKETYKSPYIYKHKILPCNCLKFIINNDTMYVINLNAFGNTLNLHKKKHYNFVYRWSKIREIS